MKTRAGQPRTASGIVKGEMKNMLFPFLICQLLYARTFNFIIFHIESRSGGFDAGSDDDDFEEDDEETSAAATGKNSDKKKLISAKDFLGPKYDWQV